MMADSGYPKDKELRKVVKSIEATGLWRYEPRPGKSKGHPKGFILCNGGTCRKAVYSTPEPPQEWAKQLRRYVAKCAHGNAVDV